MKNIKKILSAIAILILFQTGNGSAIQDSLFATVGNKAITKSDIVNEIKIILILNNQSFTEDLREQLQITAVQAQINRAVKTIEVEKYNLEYSKQELEARLLGFAEKVNMDFDTFKNTFIANGLDFNLLKEQIKTELKWNSLIFEVYKDRLSVNQEEITEQLKIIQNKKELEEFLISEIIIKSVPKDQIESAVNDLKNKIKEQGFEKTAINSSISETRLQGGDLGWINENVISENLRSEIIKTSVGNVSNHILLPEGIIIFKVRDKRKVKKKQNLEDSKNQLVNAEKTKILLMHSLSHYDNLRRQITINYY